MLPEIVRIGGVIPIYSFGLMMGIAFLVANYLFVKEFRRRGLPEEVAGTVTLIALIGGVLGAKLFSLVENWESFIADPMNEIFSAAGLTFYGGLIVATLAIFIYLRRKGLKFLTVADAAAPSLIIAYGIGRVGCQLAGDGDYGIPSDLSWAMAYPKGTVPTTGITESGDTTQLGRLFVEIFPGRELPAQVPVHPAPVYETLAAFAIFAVLWWVLRKKPMAAGRMFGIYLILAGLERLSVEFIRLNPLYLGLSQAQWISIGMMILGGVLIYMVRNNAPEPLPSYSKSPRGQGRVRPARAKAGR